MRILPLILVIGICIMGYAFTLPPATIENPDIKINLAVGGMFIIFLSMAGIMGGGK